MRITEEKLIEFDAFVSHFQKPNKQAFTAFVKVIEKFNQDDLDVPLSLKTNNDEIKD